MLVERDIKEPKNLKTLLNTELARLKENPYYKKGTYYIATMQKHYNQIIFRTWAFREHYKSFQYKEVQRRFIGENKFLIKDMYQAMFGYHVLWNAKKSGWYQYDLDDKWYMEHKQYYKVYPKCYFKYQDIATIDSRFKYAGLDLLESKCSVEDLIDYLNTYLEKPREMEMLNKGNIPFRLLFLSSFVKKMKNKEFVKFLSKQKWDQDKYITMTEVNYAYKNKVPVDCVIGFDTRFLKLFNKCKVDMSKVLRLIESNVNDSKKINKSNIRIYYDYLENIGKCNLEYTEERKYPKDLLKAHAEMLELAQVTKNKMEATEQLELENKLLKVAKKITKQLDKKYDADTEFEVIVPTTVKEFLKEGTALHHCLFTNEYYKDVASGKSIIAFVRQRDKIDEPFITVEYSPKTNEVIQMRGDHNGAPEEEVKSWIAKVFSNIKQAKEMAV